MGNFFSSLPKTILAVLALVVGFVFIVLNDPPKSVCTVQLEIFKDAQKRFLYKEQINSVNRPAQIDELLRNCREANGPGGCNELFFKLKTLNKDLNSVPSQCTSTVADENEVNNYLWKSYRLIVELAWGAKPPAGYERRFAWLDSADLALFCDLKENLTRLYGEERHKKFQEEMFSSLPQASMLTRDQIWQRTILSTRCESVK